MKNALSRVLFVSVFLICLGLLTQTTEARAQQAFESVIISNFSGLKNGNIYELQNGQIWKQTEYWIWIWTWVRPRVIIYNEGTWKMKVENIDHPVTVVRIK